MTVIVVVTYNGLLYLKNLISDFKKIGDKVIIVDNNSSDGSIDLIKSCCDNQISFIPLKTNVGFGKANNIGISRALKMGADFVFLLNQDTRLPSQTIQHLENAFTRHSDLGIVSPLHFKEEYYLDLGFEKYLLKYGFNVLNKIIKEKEPLVYVDFVNAAAWLVSKKCLEIVGGFDPVFAHYGEDNDYANRLKFHKLRIAVDFSSHIFHLRNNKQHKSSLWDIIYGHKTHAMVELRNPNIKIIYGIAKLSFCTAKMIFLSISKLNLINSWGYFVGYLQALVFLSPYLVKSFFSKGSKQKNFIHLNQ